MAGPGLHPPCPDLQRLLEGAQGVGREPASACSGNGLLRLYLEGGCTNVVQLALSNPDGAPLRLRSGCRLRPRREDCGSRQHGGQLQGVPPQAWPPVVRAAAPAGAGLQVAVPPLHTNDPQQQALELLQRAELARPHLSVLQVCLQLAAEALPARSLRPAGRPTPSGVCGHLAAWPLVPAGCRRLHL